MKETFTDRCPQNIFVSWFCVKNHAKLQLTCVYVRATVIWGLPSVPSILSSQIRNILKKIFVVEINVLFSCFKYLCRVKINFRPLAIFWYFFHKMTTKIEQLRYLVAFLSIQIYFAVSHCGRFISPFLSTYWNTIYENVRRQTVEPLAVGVERSSSQKFNELLIRFEF